MTDQKTERFEAGHWVACEWADLKKDDIFRVSDPSSAVCIVLGGDPSQGIEIADFTRVSSWHQLAPRIQVWFKGQMLGSVTSLDMQSRKCTVKSQHHSFVGLDDVVMDFDNITLSPEQPCTPPEQS